MASATSPASSKIIMANIPQVHIHKIYLRQLRFDIPQASQAFSTAWESKTEVNMDLQHEQLDECIFEVALRAHISVFGIVIPEMNDTAVANQQIHELYNMSVHQNGVFELQEIKHAEDIKAALTIYCPHILHPYLRETVDNTLLRGGFPPLQLAPMDFQHFWRRRPKSAEEEKITIH